MKHRPSIRRTLTVAMAVMGMLGSAAEAQQKSGAAQAAAGQRPNIVFMLVDNMGYGDLGVYGGGTVRGMPTPRIDSIAREGMQLTNFNVEPECTPSRSALMTGRMPIRSGTSAVALPGLPEGMTPWEYTLAELLHDAGYNTALFGKWHLGDVEGRYPTDQGFDEWMGISNSSAETLNTVQPGYERSLAPPQSILEGKRGEASRKIADYDYAKRPFIDRMITDRSVEYIGKHAHDGKPFFLYVNFTLPHTPPLPHPDFQDPRHTDFQNAMNEIDHNTGRILDALKTAGIDKDTVVVWASDNGPETMEGIGVQYGGQSDSGPFRGEFPSAWEGAIRVPGIIRWPGHVPAGKVSNEIVSILDFYRTFATWAKAADRVPADRPIDSIDQSALFLGQQEKSNREFVLFFYKKDLLGAKWRNFKIHAKMRLPLQGPIVQPGQGVITGAVIDAAYPLIFNIEADPKELWNINASSNWVAQSAVRYFLDYSKSVKEFPNIPPGAAGPSKPAKETVPDEKMDSLVKQLDGTND